MAETAVTKYSMSEFQGEERSGSKAIFSIINRKLKKEKKWANIDKNV